MGTEHESVKLFGRSSGNGPAILLLHGLFGDGANLGQLAKSLTEQFTVHSLDLRNHGRSPHTRHMNYSLMASDVVAYMDEHQITSAALIGHSMGGKVAMSVALSFPSRVTALIVADIAPVAYPPHHVKIFEGLRQLDTKALPNRKAADESMSAYIADASTRQFILKSLIKSETGFKWRINVDAIIENYTAILDVPAGQGPFDGATLFVNGGDSDYVQAKHRSQIVKLFPQAQSKTIMGASHWLHAEKPDTFNGICMRFLEEVDHAIAGDH